MALSSKSPNAIFMEIRKLSLRNCSRRYPPPPQLPVFFCLALSLLPIIAKLIVRIRFASNRAKADRSEIESRSNRAASLSLLAHNETLWSPMIPPRFVQRFREKEDRYLLSISERHVIIVRKIRVALLTTKIKLRVCPQTAAIHESGNLVRLVREAWMDGLFRFACRTRRKMCVKCESRKPRYLAARISCSLYI